MFWFRLSFLNFNHNRTDFNYPLCIIHYALSINSAEFNNVSGKTWFEYEICHAIRFSFRLPGYFPNPEYQF